MARMDYPLDLSPLREHGQFRLLWSSRTVTLLGTQVSQVALLIQARQLTGSPVLVGLLGAAEVVPLVIFGLYGGVLADRLDRRRLAVWTEAALGLTAVALTLNAAVPRPLLWPLYACAAVTMALAGLAYARHRPDLLGSYLADLAAMLLAYPGSLFPFLAAALHASWATGLMFSAQAAGAVLASVTSRWIGRVHRYGRAIALAAAGWGAAMAGLGLAPDLGAALACLVAGGAADLLSATFRDTLWNQTIPDARRGRMAGVEVLSYGLGPSAGQLRAGAVADLAGTRVALWSGGLACVAAVGLLCLTLPGFLAQDARDAQDARAPNIDNRDRC